jgi:hypothetical protein
MNTDNSNSIKCGSTFSFENIKYATPKINNLGGKNVKILDAETNEWLIISTPLMLSFGVGDYVDPQTGVGNGKYELSQLFPNTEYATEETTAFLENLKNFENKIIRDALSNSKEWFGKVHKNVDVVEALWTPMLKYSKKPNTPPYIRSKVPYYDNNWKCEVYSEDEEILFPNPDNDKITPLDIFPSKKKCNIATVLVCGGIWFTNGKFTVTWEMSQAITQKPRERVLGQKKCLIHLNKNDKEKLKKDNFEELEEEVVLPIKKQIEIEVSDNEEEDNTVDKEEKIQDSSLATEELSVTSDKKKKIYKKKNP